MIFIFIKVPDVLLSFLARTVLTESFLDQMFVHHAIISIRDEGKTGRGQNLDVAYFSLQYFTEIFKVKIGREVFPAARFSVDEE
jgi:hypothetical protein